MNDIKTAAQALVDKLDIELTKIDHAIVIANIHGHAYDAPQFMDELNNLKTALERDKATAELVKKAIYELVKHDQEIGRYDAPLCQSPCPKFHSARITSGLPKCDAGKDCPPTLLTARLRGCA